LRTAGRKKGKTPPKTTVSKRPKPNVSTRTKARGVEQREGFFGEKIEKNRRSQGIRQIEFWVKRARTSRNVDREPCR